MKKTLLTIFVAIYSLSAFAQLGLSNLDFENWVSSPMVCPAGFLGTGVTQQTSGAQSGNNYARVTTTVSSGPGSTGIMIIGSVTTQYVNGVPYVNQPVSISGYFRSNLANMGDTMGIAFELRKSGSSIAKGVTFVTATQPNWTPITVTLTYTNMINPDTLTFWVVSNPGAVGATPANAVGTYIDVDNFSINFSSGINPFDSGNHTTISFPSPASDLLTITSSAEEAAHVRIYDLGGKLVDTRKLCNKSLQLDVNVYENGVYLYQITDGRNNILSTSKFVIAK